MVGGDAIPRWGPRLLAPLAFFTAATVLVVVVHSSLNAASEGSTTPTATSGGDRRANEAGSRTDRTMTGNRRKRRFYRVRSGDTLAAIALRFDTTVADLLELNPAIEPNALAPGDRIRVR